MPDLIIFSGEDWTIFSQRAQSLALDFARRDVRVFFIEPMLSLGKIATFTLHRKSLALPVVSVENVHLLRPYLCMSTFRSGTTKWLDRYMFKKWFMLIKQKYQISTDAVVYINMPYWWGNIVDRIEFRNNKVIYDCIDDCRVYCRKQHLLARMESSEIKLAQEANIILATAVPLYKKMNKLNSVVELLSNGVDLGRFIKSKYTKPYDVEALHGPIIGFVGALYHWIDFNAIKHIAARFKDVSVVLIGPTNSDIPAELSYNYSNIHYLGPKPYDDIPDYINAFDVCLNPFKMDLIGHNVNPLKLYEYLSLGKPVVSSRTTEMENFKEYVYLYESYEDLESSIVTALAEISNNVKTVQRKNFANGNSWSTKVDRICELLSWKHV